MKRLLLLFTVLATTSSAFSQNLYSVSPYQDTLWTISDTSTMVSSSAIQLTSAGLSGITSNGLVIDPCSGAAYIVIKAAEFNGRAIGTVNLTTGVVDTLASSPEQIANIAYINDSVLAVINGDGAISSESFMLFNISDSTFTPTTPSSGLGSDGESIAFCSDNGRVYRWSGRDTNPAMEWYDLTGLPVANNVTRTGYNYDEVFSSTYVGNGQFLLANIDLEFILVDTSGFATLLPQTTDAGSSNRYFKGLAFGGPTMSFVLAGTDSICPYGSSTDMTSSAADSYQWYNNGVLIAGATNMVYSATSAGTYTCEVTRGTCTSFIDDSLVVSTYPVTPAVVSPTSGGFCPGGDLLLTGTAAGSSMWWFGGAIIDTSMTYLATVGGTYEYQLFSGSNGCYDSTSVVVTEFALPAVVANADQPSYCDGDTVTLTGSGANTYTWDNSVVDGTPFIQSVGPPVMYHVTGTDTITGCMNTDSVLVNVFANPTATGTSTDEILGNDGAIDATFTGAPTLTFDWDNDGTGDFDDPEDLTGLAAGTYTVVVMDGNGCTATTQVIVGSQVGLNEFGMNAEMSIYPNPNNGIFTVDFANMTSENLSVQIVDATGRIVFGSPVIGSSVDVNIAEFGPGSYTLMLTDGTHIATEQIIIGK